MSAKRTANFTNADRSLLIKIANLYKNIIECKKTDAITWKEKEDIWKKVEIKFNSSTTGPPRGVKQLKTKYEAIKKELKKEFSRHRTYVAGTGGGMYICPPTPKNEEEKTLAETIALSIQGLQNSFDSDGIAGISGITSNSNVTDNVEVEIECVSDDWTPPNTKLLRLPVNPILRSPLRNTNENEDACDTYEHDTDISFLPECNSEITASTDHTYGLMPEDTEVKKDERAPKIKSWSSRRRPIQTKKKCLTSAGAKFETLAEQKCELVALERKTAQEKLLQNQKKHEERMKILILQRQQEELKLEMIKHPQCNCMR